MRRIEIDAAQDIFESLVDEVEQGATVKLMRGGKVVALMEPCEPVVPKSATTAIPQK